MGISWKSVGDRGLRFGLAALLGLCSLMAAAQPYPSQLGRFQVDQKRGCAPFTVTVTNLLAGTCIAGISPCAIDYIGDGATVQTNPPLPIMHTYNTPGTYQLTLIYQSLAVQKDIITITVDANTQPNFEIWACAARKASIKVTDNVYDQYVIDYNNDGVSEAIIPFSSNMLAPPYTYAPAGTYTTSVRGRRLNAADNCAAKTQPFTTYNTLPTPKVNKLTSLDPNSVKLDFSISPNIEYRVEIATNNSTTFQLYQSLYGINTMNVNSLMLDANFYCFRIGAFDPCLGVSTYSNIVCSSMFDVTAASDVNHLTWTTGNTPQVVNYAITRNGNNFVTVGGVLYNDTNIICRTDYCYQATTTYTGGATSISLSKCVTSFSLTIPTAIDDVNATVGGGVTLEWQQDPLFVPVSYSIFRNVVNTPFSLFATTLASPYADDTYSTEGNFCYQIKYIDQCHNFSNLGTVICPIRLTGKVSSDNQITLNWNGYKGYAAGVKNYVIDKYSLSGLPLGSVTVSPSDTTYVDSSVDPNNQYVLYKVRATPKTAGLKVSTSNPAEFIKNANFYFPTAFTPNSNGLNDTFKVTGQFIDTMNMKIFDRWGNIIYATSRKEDSWDGSGNDGKHMPPSTYVWKVEITDLAGRTFNKEGIIALIRD